MSKDNGIVSKDVTQPLSVPLTDEEILKYHHSKVLSSYSLKMAQLHPCLDPHFIELHD